MGSGVSAWKSLAERLSGFILESVDVIDSICSEKSVNDVIFWRSKFIEYFFMVMNVLRIAGCLDLPQGDSMDVGRQIKVGRAWKALGVMGRSRENVSVPYAVNSKCYVHYDSRINADTGRNFKSMNFVRGILEEDGRDFMAGSPFPRPPNMESNADIVHVKLMRNNTFITVTDNKGNTKLKASAGRLEELKGGPKLSRYAAEAIAEYVGRESRKLGLKSVVMRVKGFTYFKKKRQAIMSWRDGFTDSRSDQNPIVYIEDTTRRAHNGCRLPKQRRV